MRGRSGGGCPEVNLALRGGTDALRSEPTSLHVSLSPTGLSQTSQRSPPREGPTLSRPAAGTAASVPARATPGSPAPSLQPPGVEAAAEPREGPSGFQETVSESDLAAGAASERGLRLPGSSTSGLSRPFPGTGRCMPRPTGAQLPGSRAGSRAQEMPPKDASPGRLSRQEPRELTDTFPNKVPLSRGTMTGGREKSRSQARSNRSGAEGPPGPGNPTLGKTVTLKAILRSCHFLLYLACELKVAAPGVSASRASHFLLL